MSDWERFQDLFTQVAELEPGARAQVLREQAGGDEELVRRVEALLAADSTPLDTFDGTAADLLEKLRSERPAADLCGTRFGSYLIEEHLSSGGMGHVYRATRTSAGTERRVALKVLRPALGTAEFLERFQREREVLAALEHEHIVSFLDAGALPDGRPYLVMQLVDGVPLTEWGRDESLRARIELFLQVLAAVQYAHQQLVVHRDLKPSNVLVTAQGVPKLLDFGVAAALDLAPLRGDGAGEADAVLENPLTPVYASPEQRSGQPTSTASDVYSLGVLLGELATGHIPDPGPHPGPAPSQLPLLRDLGDLGAVIARALAVEPTQRYRSPDHMAADLRRYLASEPVSARRAGWTYRARLFARRNRWPLGAALAVILALATGWIASDLGRRRARGEASLGWRAHAQARVTARLFEDWIASVAATDPALAEDAAAHLERALAEHLGPWPEAETLVRLTLAELYLERGEPERAGEHARRALDLARVTRGVGTRERERAEALLQRAGSGD